MGKHRKAIKQMWWRLTPMQKDTLTMMWKNPSITELDIYLHCRRFTLNNGLKEVNLEINRETR